MVHWSQFAGSLWDSVLAPHVHAKDLVSQALTFNAAIDDFILSNFTQTNERWSVSAHRRSQYVQFCFDNLTLMACRTILPSLQVKRQTSDLLQVSITAMAHVRVHGWDTTNTYLLRYQMVTTLAASLHLLCSALFRNRLDDFHLRQWVPSGKAEYLAAVDLLNALGQTIPLAQRVLGDFEVTLPVIRRVFARCEEEPSTSEVSPDCPVLGDGIPLEAAELLPYREQVPDIRHSMLYNFTWDMDGGFIETGRGLSPGDASVDTSSVRNSLLWV